ncbi:MAG: type II toxin-antitoxin system RelB/DinJ family antitoxin [Candidatus Dadabacteria bacterium]|nr:type II toxin-antitoxin system RelB/DinJ family antitoxin [Candidatus Dadabacteria bacterium]MYA48444.1 type II toxin-antitoxin system RelB/DinJ family antitoxin [Candidatus Dadabacteria bacterium]MYF48305.1 type II toxin-antitoxin system RelB/DinJ family antitoxin [Candidatus Dadabacteria bacterium]MYG83521.1 type II toxin-antitoxin system RelB/DinJ family antitoxin [Candidatus Dadabacteria bacterium]MYK48905.1 type II toxin-antitoxin system RelB/DinJ family antitoxin [Candidatus Dadabacter
MAKTEMIRARIEPELKQEVEKIFSALGLSPTEAITLFYKQVTFYRGLPFTVRIPREETLEAIRQTRSGKGLVEYSDIDELMTEFDNA